MPTQTTLKNIFFPDGTKVSIKAYGEVSYTDLGAIEQGTQCVLNFDEVQVETGNAGKLNRKGKNFTIAGSFSLIHWDLANINRFGGGMFTLTTTAASATTSIPNQVIAAGWADNKKYELLMYTSSSDSTKLRVSAKPTITSVSLGAGSPETLTENNDYVIVADGNSYSGWSIQFISANMSTGSPTTYAITVDYGSNTPIATQTINCGASSVEFDPYQIKFEHTDDAGLKRTMEIFSADTNSGGFAVNMKGANEDGVESIPFAFTGKCDSTLSSGYQLFRFTVDNGAA